MLFIASLLLAAPQAPIISVPRERSIRIARGPLGDMQIIEYAARRCGMKEVGISVPDGPDYPTSIHALDREWRGQSGICLRAWRSRRGRSSAVWVS